MFKLTRPIHCTR